MPSIHRPLGGDVLLFDLRAEHAAPGPVTIQPFLLTLAHVPQPTAEPVT